MNYYDFHIGDFRSATSHLTRIERSIYRDMIDMYYDTEEPLPLDLKMLNRKLAARDQEEQEAVIALLDEFFIKTESGYFNSRCDEEIQKYHSNQSKKSIAGKASAAKREQEKAARLALLNGHATDDQLNVDSDEHLFQQNSTGVEQTMDSSSSSVQLTNNQKPITNNQKETKVSKNSLSQNADTDEQAKTILVDDWQPSLADMDESLFIEPCSLDKFNFVLAKFKKQNFGKRDSIHSLELSLANWINREIEKPVAKQRKPVTPTIPTNTDYGTRTTDTSKTKERKFEDYHDDQIYSGTFKAGQIRKALEVGESPDQCVLRLTKAQLAGKSLERV